MMGARTPDLWLSALSPREIVWLMMELHQQTWSSTWFTPETANASINMLRRALLERDAESATA